MYFYGVYTKKDGKLARIYEIVDVDFERDEIFARTYNKEINNFDMDLQILSCELKPLKVEGYNWFKFFRITKINNSLVKDAYAVFGNELDYRGDETFEERNVFFWHKSPTGAATIKDARFFWKYVQGFTDVDQGAIQPINPYTYVWCTNKRKPTPQAFEMSMEFSTARLRRV